MNSKIEISTDKSQLNIEMIFDYLSNHSYWAKGRNYTTVKKSIENSFCFGVYLNEEQIGFARVVTDFSVFAWIMDVFIVEKNRGKGFGKSLMQEIKDHAELQTIKRWGLCTDDAHDLYKQFGFHTLDNPDIMMELTIKQ